MPLLLFAVAHAVVCTQAFTHALHLHREYSGRETVLEGLQDAATPWHVDSKAIGFTFDTSGTFDSPQGSSLTMRSTTDLVPLALSKSIPADKMRLQRLKLSGRLKTNEVSRYATLGVRVEGPSGVLVRKGNFTRRVEGTSGWTDIEVEFPIPTSATRLTVGLLLSGTGTAEVQSLKLSSVGTIDTSAPIAKAPQRLLDEAIRIVRTNAAYRDTVSWAKLLPEVREIAAGAQREADVHPAIELLLTRLGDRHSVFTARGVFKPKPNVIPPVRVIDGSVGYVQIFNYMGTNAVAGERHVSTVYKRLADAKKSVRCGWIVDLRENSGGNFGPMLSSLRPFLGDNALGFFVGSGDREEWSAKRAADGLGVLRPRDLDELLTQPVAVLTGPRTGSSGELVTIAFRGRARTRSFGLPTYGVSTGNSGYMLSDGSQLTLTTAIDMDRNGVMFGNEVRPDSLFEFATAEPKNGVDPVQAAAVAWLRSESQCEMSGATHRFD